MINLHYSKKFSNCTCLLLVRLKIFQITLLPLNYETQEQFMCFPQHEHTSCPNLWGNYHLNTTYNPSSDYSQFYFSLEPAHWQKRAKQQQHKKNNRRKQGKWQHKLRSCFLTRTLFKKWIVITSLIILSFMEVVKIIVKWSVNAL